MQDKQKVTLYLPSSVHRQLKIKAALDADSMSALVEKAIAFYLQHPEVVEEVKESYGQTHRLHICPECESPVVVRDGQMISLKRQPTILSDGLSDLPGQMQDIGIAGNADFPGEVELVSC